MVHTPCHACPPQPPHMPPCHAHPPVTHAPMHMPLPCMHPVPCTPPHHARPLPRTPPKRSKRYASYWNAVLVFINDLFPCVLPYTYMWLESCRQQSFENETSSKQFHFEKLAEFNLKTIMESFL